jgi:hypothetical protein
MALSDCLKKIHIEQDIADFMLDRSSELVDGGMDQLTADRQVVAEMFKDIEETLDQIGSQLKINRDGSPLKKAEFAGEMFIEEKLQKAPEKPKAKAKPKVKSRSAILTEREPESFLEAVLRFFVKGGRVRTADFVRYVGYPTNSSDFRHYIWAVKNDGVHLDVFNEQLKNSFGMEDKGAMDMINEIVDILRKYPGRSSMMDELQRLQSEEQMPDNMLPPEADMDAEITENEAEVVELHNDIWSDPDMQDIFDKYSTDAGLDVNKLLDDLNNNPEKVSNLAPFGLRDNQKNDLKKYLEDEQSRRKENQIPESTQGLDQNKGKSGEENAPRSDQGDQVRPGPEEKPAEEEITIPTSKNKEYKYRMELRPFDIGTYPKEGYVSVELVPGDKYETLTYNRKLTPEEISHWSFTPMTEIAELKGKEFIDKDGEFRVILNWLGNDRGADVSMFDKEGVRVERPFFMGASEIMKNINSGYWKELPNKGLKAVVTKENVGEFQEAGAKAYYDELKRKRTGKMEVTFPEHIAKGIEKYLGVKVYYDKNTVYLNKPEAETKPEFAGEIVERPKVTAKQPPQYSPIQQTQIDKINKEYSELIAKKQEAIAQTEKDMRDALLKADERNGLFGDTKPVEKDEIVKRDEQGFTYNDITRAAIRKTFEEKIAQLNKEIKELTLEQKGKIESIVQQRDLFAEPSDLPLQLDKESMPKLEDFGEKIGGARKDMGITRTVRDVESMPAWRRKYSYANADGTIIIGGEIDTSKPFMVQWAKEVDSWGGKRTRYTPVTAIDTRNPKIFNSVEEAEAYIPIYEVWRQRFRIRKKEGNYVITKTSSTDKVIEYATFTTEEEANTYMYSTEGATSLLNHKREDFSIPALDKVERTGKDWRKGKDISADEFMNTFGFRGGEFGNWVKPEERRVMLNAAYDSFMDLAEITGLPPKALSLSGELSIAFGARGTKGAAAHFEPQRAVINLTRMNGAGSLAHEWAHAMDSYFGLQGAKKDYTRNDKGELIAGRAMRTEAGLLSIQGMRKELSDLFNAIIDATQEKSVTRVMGIEEKQKAYDKAKERVKSEAETLLRKFENGARRYQYNRKTKQREEVLIKATPEQINKLNQILDKIVSGEGSKPIWSHIPGSKGHMEYSYISPETLALEELYKEVFGRSGLKRDGSGFYNLGYFAARLYPAKETLDKALSGESETLKIPTDYLKNSKQFDRSRANPYWSTKVEMFARAFEYYVETKLQDQNQRADYLQYDKAPVYEAVYGMNPYPSGEERNDLNKLFENFFKAVETKEENGKVAMFRVSDAIYFSPVEKALKAIKQEKGTPEQWKAMLLNNGAKQTELDWMGFDEFIKDKKSLTKDNITTWINQNKIEVKEVEHGKSDDPKLLKLQDEFDKAKAKKDRYRENIGGDPFWNFPYKTWYYTDTDGNPRVVPSEFIPGLEDYKKKEQALNDYIEEHIDVMGDLNMPGPKYEQYTLPGGEDYKELLLTMPSRSFSQPELTDDELIQREKANGMRVEVREDGKLDVYGNDHIEPFIGTFANEKDLANAIRKEYENTILRELRTENEFHSGHWEEPNVLAHVRFNTRTTPDGKNILFIEEIQSDWAQKGKKEGFANPREEELYLLARKIYYLKRNISPWNETQTVSGLRVSYKEAKEKGFTDQELADITEKYGPDFTKTPKGYMGVPDMPFKQTDQWAGLAMRRMIRYAIDNGYDAIAWTPGEVQNERYDLSKKVDEIRVYDSRKDKKKDNTNYHREIEIVATGGRKINFDITKEGTIIEGPSNLYNKPLDEVVGKDMAEKILNSSVPNRINGLDLKIGGHGMTGFYDQILPSIANKIGKKFGSKTEPLTMISSQESALAKRFKEIEDRLDYLNARQDEILKDFSSKTGQKQLAEDYNSNGEEIQKLLTEKSDMERRVSPRILNKQIYTNAVHSLPITPAMFESYRQGIPLFREKNYKGEALLDYISNNSDARDNDLREKINSLGASFNTPIVVIKNKYELSATLQRQAKRDKVWDSRITGVWDPQSESVIVLLDGIRELGDDKAMEEVTKTILHEVVAHKGLPELLGQENYDQLLDDIYWNIPQDDRSLIMYDYSTTDKRTIAKEYLASMAEENVNPNLFQRVLAKIRQLFRKLFKLNFSENDIHNLLRQSKENLQKPKASDFEFAGEYLYRIAQPGPAVSVLKSAAERYKEKESKRTLPETIQGIREYIQDINLPVRRFEEDLLKRGGKQDNDSKPYRDMSLAFGRQEELYTKFFKQKMKPVLQSVSNIKRAGMPGDEILPYIISKHAIERNAVMRGMELRDWVDSNQDATPDDIDAKKDELSNKDYSGVMEFDVTKKYTNPDELASDIVREFESKVDKKLIDDLWANMKAATTTILDTWEQGNQITAAQKQDYIEQYRYFVPLRGWRDGAAKDLIYTKGEGFSKSLQQAEGRKSLADNPLAYILNVQFQAIAEQVDNEVKTSMLNLIMKNLSNNEMNELATIKKLYYEKITLPDGTIEWEPTTTRPAPEKFASGDAKTKIYNEHERLRKPRQAREHEVTVHRPGGDMVMVFKGKNLSTAQALNKQNYMYRTIFGNIYDARDLNKVMALMGHLNNMLKALYTSWNVVFPFTNFMRDFQEATITQAIKSGTALKVMKNYTGAFPAIIRHMKDKPDMNNKTDRDLNDFYTFGGATGYTHNKTIEEIEREVNDEVERMVRKGTVTGSMSHIVHKTKVGVEYWNRIFEDATRFSVYLSSLAAGNTKQDAASDAKEASVNFNRKGKGSKAWDAWFAFFNVAVQSMQKNFKLAKDVPVKFTAVATSFMMLGFLEALMNALLDDDDDKESSYYNINPYMRQNYLIIPLPKLSGEGKANKYLSIPLPQFWRGFKSMGSIAFDVARGKIKTKDAIMDAIGNFASSLLPVDVGGFYKSGEFSFAPIMPTITKPIIEVLENQNYMGYSIKNEPFTRDDKKYLANAGLGKNNVNPAAKFFTDMLFRWGGGEGKYKYYRNGDLESRKVFPLLDINPSTLEHLFKGYTGGTGGVLSDLIVTVKQAVSPDESIDFKNVPFVNRFIRKTPEAKWNIIAEYYNLRDDYTINNRLDKDDVKQAEETGDWSRVTAAYGNEYLQQYKMIFQMAEKELDYATKEKKYDLIEGSRYAVEIMDRTNEQIKALKEKYNKK